MKFNKQKNNSNNKKIKYKINKIKKQLIMRINNNKVKKL